MISDVELLEYIRPVTDDDLPTLRRLEKSAVAYCEQRTGRYLRAVGTVTEYVQWTGWPIGLANAPIGAVTSFESWTGSAWTAVSAPTYQQLSNFIYFQTSASLPALSLPSRYRVVYNAGYTAGATVDEWDAPEDIKQAVLMAVGHWFENREGVIVGGAQPSELPLAVTALLDGHIRMAV